jgi:hypothetical protein
LRRATSAAAGLIEPEELVTTSRRDAAVRDFYDISYAVGNAGIKPDVDEFIELVRHKLTVPGNEPITKQVLTVPSVRFPVGLPLFLLPQRIPKRGDRASNPS